MTVYVTNYVLTRVLRMRGIYAHAWGFKGDMESKSDLEAVLCSSGDLTAMMCDAADFISRYQWIWDVQMTKFFQLQHWNKIPSEVCFYTIDSRDIT